MEIRSERILPIFRGEGEQQHQIAVSYQMPNAPIPRTVWVHVEEHFEKNAEEFLKQHAEKKGSLYDEWLKIRNSKIREDIERWRSYKTEKVTV